MAMFSQNPVLDGPNYSFAEAPQVRADGFREHRFNPYVQMLHEPLLLIEGGTTTLPGANMILVAQLYR